MKRRKRIAILFSCIYLAPFFLGGWYLAIGGLMDNFWGVPNSFGANLQMLVLVTLYGVVFAAILGFILKYNFRRMISYTSVLVSIICLLIILIK